MTRTYWLSATAGAIAIGMYSVAAQAAPLGGVTGGVKATQGDNALAQEVRWGRRCWRHRGRLHCRRAPRRTYRYYYNDPYYYSDPFFYGPSIGFSFRSGHRHRHHGHHRHHR